MIIFPKCRWRGELKSSGYYDCLSPKLRILGPGVDYNQCVNCYCRDHKPGETIKPKSTALCIHLGEVIRLKECDSCRGKVSIKIFECKQYKECTIYKKLPEITSCSNCGSYWAKL